MRGKWSLILILFSCFSIAFSKNIYQFKEQYPLNQPVTHEMKMDFSLELTKAGPQGPEQFKVSNQSLEKYTETILQLDPQGFPIQARRDYQIAEEIENGQTIPVSYQGKSVFLQKVGDKTQAGAPGLSLSPKEIENFQDELSEAESQALLPPNPIGIGQTWISDERAVVKLLGLDENTRGTMKGKLINVGPYANQNCAQLEINLIATTHQSGMVLSIDLTGKVYFSLDQNRIIAMEFQGPMQANGQIATESGAVPIQGQGQIQGYFKEV